VGKSGLLVHNLSQSCNLFSKGYFGGDFNTPDAIYSTGENDRAEMVEARVCETGQIRPSLPNPEGWDSKWNEGLGRGKARVARCHLLGNQFKGAGAKNNLVPCCQTANHKMAKTENEIAEFIENYGCVDILVTANYANKEDTIPTSISITAKGMDCSKKKCTSFGVTVFNPKSLNLFDCKVAGAENG
tara:strand:+ start:500 stop:1060 length:561 start_codon:yes stop_codon:yes gene_type:complete